MSSFFDKRFFDSNEGLTYRRKDCLTTSDSWRLLLFTWLTKRADFLHRAPSLPFFDSWDGNKVMAIIRCFDTQIHGKAARNHKNHFPSKEGTVWRRASRAKKKFKESGNAGPNPPLDGGRGSK